MARVLIIEPGPRTADAEAALTDAGYAVRSVAPKLAGDVVDALEGVAVVAWLMAASDDPTAQREMLETVLLKVVDTGVRGFVHERSTEAPNAHVEHAIATWHLPVATLESDGPFDEALVAAVGRSLGL